MNDMKIKHIITGEIIKVVLFNPALTARNSTNPFTPRSSSLTSKIVQMALDKVKQ